MSIVFFCQSCGARFEVADRAASKKGRCKKCGQLVRIPQAEQLASLRGMPAVTAAALTRGSSTASASESSPLTSWLNSGESDVGLAPLSVTVKRLPSEWKRGGAAPPIDDDLGDSKPYLLKKPTREERRAARRRTGQSGPANVLVRFWRHETGTVQKIFRWLNDSAYLVSIPFMMILLAAVVLRNRPIALGAATVVVLLNIGRLGAGVVNLAIVPLRDGFDARKYKKPLRRVLGPVATVGLVILAFTFIPWLRNPGASSGSVVDRVRQEAESLQQEMQGEVKLAVDKAKTLDARQIEEAARAKLKSLNQIGGSPDENPQPESRKGDPPGQAP
jgi:hypothetical protein